MSATEEKSKKDSVFGRRKIDPYVEEKQEVELLLQIALSPKIPDLVKQGEKQEVWGAEALERCVRGKFLDERFQITPKGKERIKEMREHLAALKQGVPFASRRGIPYCERDLYRIPSPEWQTGSLGSQLPITTNGEFLFLGRVGVGELKEMPARLGGTGLKTRVRRFLSRQTGFYQEVKPLLFQTDGELWPRWEAVWLSDERSQIKIAIRAHYFDYVKIRYPSAQITASEEQGKAVKICSYRRGIGEEGIVAAVLPLQLEYPQIFKGIIHADNRG